MKTSQVFILGWMLLWPSISAAAVFSSPGFVRVEGVINGGLIAPGRVGDTMDYLKFEVLSSGTVTATSGFGGAHVLRLAQYIGVNDEFGLIGGLGPFRLFQTSSVSFDSMSIFINPGIYVASVGMHERSSYDIFDGFRALNPEGGGFTLGPYAYSLAGDLRPLEFWDGELNNTFIVTQVPEPGTAFLIGGSALFLLQRSGTSRKKDKALQQTVRGLLVSTLKLIRKCLGFGRAQPLPQLSLCPKKACPFVSTRAFKKRNAIRRPLRSKPMKIPLTLLSGWMLLHPAISAAAVFSSPGFVRVEGVINGSGSTLGVRGDTMDYLKFEVLSSGTVTALLVSGAD